MSDETNGPEPRSTESAAADPAIEPEVVEPEVVEPGVVEPREETTGYASTTEATSASAPEVVPAAAEPVPVTADPAEVPAAEPAEVPVVPAEPVAPPAAAPAQVVYVESPIPPRPRGNRVVGVLLALVGAVVFAVVYAVVGGLFDVVGGAAPFGREFAQFVGSAAFWVPILVFALAFILLVLVVNRAGWAAHVFGSLLLAFVVYLASIGLLLLVGNVFPGRQTANFSQIALSPQIIASAVIAREVAIWLGLGIAARGRRVKARNVEAREQYERDLADRRAQYERPTTDPER
jgi:hypothetical protein